MLPTTGPPVATSRAQRLWFWNSVEIGVSAPFDQTNEVTAPVSVVYPTMRRPPSTATARALGGTPSR